VLTHTDARTHGQTANTTPLAANCRRGYLKINLLTITIHLYHWKLDLRRRKMSEGTSREGRAETRHHTGQSALRVMSWSVSLDTLLHCAPLLKDTDRQIDIWSVKRGTGYCAGC